MQGLPVLTIASRYASSVSYPYGCPGSFAKMVTLDFPRSDTSISVRKPIHDLCCLCVCRVSCDFLESLQKGPHAARAATSPRSFAGICVTAGLDLSSLRIDRPSVRVARLCQNLFSERSGARTVQALFFSREAHTSAQTRAGTRRGSSSALLHQENHGIQDKPASAVRMSAAARRDTGSALARSGNGHCRRAGPVPERRHSRCWIWVTPANGMAWQRLKTAAS